MSNIPGWAVLRAHCLFPAERKVAAGQRGVAPYRECCLYWDFCSALLYALLGRVFFACSAISQATEGK